MKTRKINLKIIAILAAAFTIFATSCDIDEGINNSPNAVNEEAVKSVEGVYALTIGMQSCIADFYSADRSRIGSIWCWQMCAPPGLGRPQPTGWNNYQMTQDGPTDDMWKNNAYRGIRISTDVINYTPDLTFGDNNTQIQNSILGMAKTYRALWFGELAALYGSIPIDINGLEPPQLVDQQAAYAEVQNLLDQALTHFSDAAAYGRDLNFGGDGTAWTEVIHSLKARYYLHVGNYTDAMTQANMGISSADNTLYAIYSDNAGEFSPWGHWTLTEAGEPIRVEKYFMDMLKSEADDNRIEEYFLPNAEGEYWGYAVRNAAEADTHETNADYTAHLKKYGAYADNFPLISYEENILIKAECMALADDLPGAATQVNMIRTMAGLPDYTPGTKEETIAEILKQKYLELFLEAQCYHDMRRTGSLPDDNIPKRWIYPESEINANPNVPADDDNLVRWILNVKYGGVLE